MKLPPLILSLVAIALLASPAAAHYILWSHETDGTSGALVRIRSSVDADCEMDAFVNGQDFASYLGHWTTPDLARKPAHQYVQADYPLPALADVQTARGILSPWNVLPRVSPYDALPQVNYETYLDTDLTPGEHVVVFAHERIRVWDPPSTIFMFLCLDPAGIEVVEVVPLTVQYADHTDFPRGGLGARVNALGDRLLVADNRSMTLDLPHGGLAYFQGYGHIAGTSMTLGLEGPAGYEAQPLGTTSFPARLNMASDGPTQVTASYDGTAAGGTVWMPFFALGYPPPASP